MSQQKRTAHPRRHRPRPTPKWLLAPNELDQVAQRRCLMLLSVLSGEKAVTDAIEEAQISRQLYYQLETRALQAMLRAVSPGSDEASGPATTGGSRVAELEAKLAKLEREKRRAERLLLLTRKTVQAGTLKTHPGRPRTSRRSPSPRSTASGNAAFATLPTRTSSTSERPSSPTTDGGAVPSSGSES